MSRAKEGHVLDFKECGNLKAHGKHARKGVSAAFQWTNVHVKVVVSTDTHPSVLKT